MSSLSKFNVKIEERLLLMEEKWDQLVEQTIGFAKKIGIIYNVALDKDPGDASIILAEDGGEDHSLKYLHYI